MAAATAFLPGLLTGRGGGILLFSVGETSGDNNNRRRYVYVYSVRSTIPIPLPSLKGNVGSVKKSTTSIYNDVTEFHRVLLDLERNPPTGIGTCLLDSSTSPNARTSASRVSAASPASGASVDATEIGRVYPSAITAESAAPKPSTATAPMPRAGAAGRASTATASSSPTRT